MYCCLAAVITRVAMSVMLVTTLVLTSIRPLVISSSAVVTVTARAAAVGWSWSRWPSSLGSSTSFVSGVCYSL